MAVMLAYRPWNQVEGGDPAVYDYIAQSILRGQLPYRDVVDIKAPGGGYLSALAMSAGNFIGVRDVIAVRLMNVMLVGLLSAATYLVAEAFLKQRLLGVLAFLIPLMPEHFATMLISGTQPKLPKSEPKRTLAMPTRSSMTSTRSPKKLQMNSTRQL